jgi:membrane-bound acyltransferase YfiQ involved in biofilm formation
LIKGIVVENKYLSQACTVISDYSYGVYLVHIIIIGVLFRNGIYWSFAHPIVSLPLLLLMVLLSSMVVIFFIRKIPGGKYISG